MQKFTFIPGEMESAKLCGPRGKHERAKDMSVEEDEATPAQTFASWVSSVFLSLTEKPCSQH